MNKPAQHTHKLKKKHPVFKRPNYGRTKRKRIKDNWRKPQGMDNAQRKQKKKAGRLPEIGYRNPKALRHLHPTGKTEILVANPAEVENIKATDAKAIVLRIRKSVGTLKRKKIAELATARGFAVANYKQ